MHLFAIFATIIGIVEAEIEMAQVIFRHGDRGASNRYPTDPNSEADWPRGYSQLTETGYRQAEELGEYLNYRYRTQMPLLSDKYTKKQVYVRSSDKDRCIETAMGVTSKLFKDHVVPVHTYSAHWKDLLLKPNSVRCLRADQLEAADKAALHKEKDAEYSDLFEYLSTHTGMKVTMKNVKDIYNAVFREYSNGLPQPSWVFDSVYPEVNMTAFDYIVELKRLDRITSFNSFEKSRLRTGFLLGKLTSSLNDRAIGISHRKIELFATHDATVTSLMYSLGVSDDQLPPYASAIMLELHRDDEQYYVKVLYRNSTTSDPVLLAVPGCRTAVCTLAEFQDTVSSRTIHSEDEHHLLCENHEPEEHVPESLPKTTTVIIREPTKMVIYGLLMVQIYFVVLFYFKSIEKEYLH